MAAVRFIARLFTFVLGCTSMNVPPDDPPCPGCISSEMPADSTMGGVFNDYGNTLQVQTQAMAHKAGENNDFTEFVPIRYAWQRVAGIKYYVKVRVGDGQFVDVQIYSSWDESAAPVITSVTLHVAEDVPISGTDGGPVAASPPQIDAQIEACPGCRSDETDADADIVGLFHEHADAILPQAVAMAQAQHPDQNAEFTELTPVRYAWQRVAGVVYFVKARVSASVFADLRIFQSYEEGKLPQVTGLVFGVGEKAPITDFGSPAVAV